MNKAYYLRFLIICLGKDSNSLSSKSTARDRSLSPLNIHLVGASNSSTPSTSNSTPGTAQSTGFVPLKGQDLSSVEVGNSLKRKQEESPDPESSTPSLKFVKY